MHVPAMSTEAGMALAIGDACETPAQGDGAHEIAPYPNVAEGPGCERTSGRVLIQHRETVVLCSERPATTGDHEGSGGGVVSGTVGGKAVFRTASSKVYAERHRIVGLTSRSAHNGSSANMPRGTVVVPSQHKVLVAP